MALDMDKLHEFLGRALVDFGATFHAALVRIGARPEVAVIQLRKA